MSGAKKGVGNSHRHGLPAAEASDVDEMLRAAEDELLMGLHVGSHTISSSSLDLDLARRFEALKTPRLRPTPKATQPIRPPQPSASQSKAIVTNDQIRDDAMIDDLMSRFAALKGSTSKPQPTADPISDLEDFTDDEQGEDGDCGNKVSKTEVEKVILWAMDAARLDPSVRNDVEDDVDKESDEEDDDVTVLESELEEKKNRDKGKRTHGEAAGEFIISQTEAMATPSPSLDSSGLEHYRSKKLSLCLTTAD